MNHYEKKYGTIRRPSILEDYFSEGLPFKKGEDDV